MLRTRGSVRVLILILLFSAITSYGKSNRSERSRVEFKQKNPCPSTQLSRGSCPGYIIDHIKPLACGGVDTSINMQWQTIEDAKQKDLWERAVCNNPDNPYED
jgi:hypothetical protein